MDLMALIAFMKYLGRLSLLIRYDTGTVTARHDA